MKIDCVKVGRLRCNCYILDKNGEVLVIDPGDEFEKIDIYRQIRMNLDRITEYVNNKLQIIKE